MENILFLKCHWSKSHLTATLSIVPCPIISYLKSFFRITICYFQSATASACYNFSFQSIIHLFNRSIIHHSMHAFILINCFIWNQGNYLSKTTLFRCIFNVTNFARKMSSQNEIPTKCKTYIIM